MKSILKNGLICGALKGYCTTTSGVLSQNGYCANGFAIDEIHG
jgi:hypothetical protein